MSGRERQRESVDGYKKKNKNHPHLAENNSSWLRSISCTHFFPPITISLTPPVSLVSGWGKNKKGSFSLSLQVKGSVHYLSADLHFQTRTLSLVEKQPGDNNAGGGERNNESILPFVSYSLTQSIAVCGSCRHKISMPSSFYMLHLFKPQWCKNLTYVQFHIGIAIRDDFIITQWHIASQ